MRSRRPKNIPDPTDPDPQQCGQAQKTMGLTNCGAEPDPGGGKHEAGADGDGSACCCCQQGQRGQNPRHHRQSYQVKEAIHDGKGGRGGHRHLQIGRMLRMSHICPCTPCPPPPPGYRSKVDGRHFSHLWGGGGVITWDTWEAKVGTQILFVSPQIRKFSGSFRNRKSEKKKAVFLIQIRIGLPLIFFFPNPFHCCFFYIPWSVTVWSPPYRYNVQLFRVAYKTNSRAWQQVINR